MTACALSNVSRTKRAAIAFTTSLTILSFAAAPSFAQKRTPAPIVFAGQGSHSAPTQRTQTTKAAPRKLSRKERRAAKRAAKQASATASSQPEASARRVEFRYPDQPDVYYGEGGARADANAAPLSFSSSTSAITEAEAAKYSHTDAPILAAASGPQKDPAITAGGFDARAAAARSAAKAKPTLVSAAGPVDFSSAPLKTEVRPVPQTASYQAPATRPVSGTPFEPNQNAIYDKTGTASVFHPVLNGQPTSTGEILDTQAMVAAHPSLPLPSLVQVINLENDREVVVRVNDRGPIDGNGLIEVSERAADVLGFGQTGQANVRVRYLGEAPVLAPDEEPATVQPPAAAAPAPTPPVTEPPLFKTAPSPVSPAPSTESGEQFVVQLASFSDIGNAQRMYASLGSHVGNLGIVPANVNGTDYFRVVAGPLDNRQAAEQLRDQLANQGVGRGLVKAAS